MATFNALDAEQLRRQGAVVLDHMARYWEGLKTQRAVSKVQPGYLAKLLPKEAPRKAEKLEDVMKDLDDFIMPGLTHWQSVHFHAYYPASISYPALLADLVSNALGIVGLSWDACPSCTELEKITMKWLAQLMCLPECFYEGPKSAGVIQGSASESTLVAFLSARSKAIKLKNVSHSDKMVVYFSKESHCSVERAAMILLIQSRKVEVDGKGSMCIESLRRHIEQDIAQGLTPIMCVACLGTTTLCSFDRLDLIAVVCQEYDLWIHVDAAYAGSAFVCPEMRYLMQGIEHVDSFNMSPHKWLLVNDDCSALWFKDTSYMAETFKVDPVFLQYSQQDVVSDFRHLAIPLSRRFRSLKLWFVMKMVGVEGLQEYIRKDIRLAKLFETLVRADADFEVVNEVLMGLVCFRLKAGNAETRELCEGIRRDGRLYMTPAQSDDVFYIRFVICSQLCQQDDIENDWLIIRKVHRRLKEQKAVKLVNGDD